MSAYSCPDCENGTLEAQFREVEIDLKDGESVELIDGRVYASSVRCDNGCSDPEHAPPPDDLRSRRLQKANAAPPQQKTAGR